MENKPAVPMGFFRSTTRWRLLALFLTNPQSRYYARQLQSQLKVSIGSLHRELRSLEALGVLKSQWLGNLRLYAADPSYPLFAELKSIVSKTVGVEGLLAGVLKEITGIESAFIYGSFASGTPTPDSDIDLFIIGGFDESRLNLKLREVEAALAREVNYTAMTKEEFLQERKKGTAFLNDVQAAPKLFLIGEVNAFG